jgi:hypothetical protein
MHGAAGSGRMNSNAQSITGLGINRMRRRVRALTNLRSRGSVPQEGPIPPPRYLPWNAHGRRTSRHSPSSQAGAVSARQTAGLKRLRRSYKTSTEKTDYNEKLKDLGSTLVALAGDPRIMQPGGNSVPSVTYTRRGQIRRGRLAPPPTQWARGSRTSAPAPTRHPSPIFAPFRMIAPMPMSVPSPTVQPCSIAMCPMETRLPSINCPGRNARARAVE